MEIISSILVIILFTGFVKLATVLQVLQYGLGLRGVAFSVVMLVFAFILSILSVSSTLSDGDFNSLIYLNNESKSLKSEFEKYRPFLKANSNDDTTNRLLAVLKKENSNDTNSKITGSKSDAVLLLSFTLTQIETAFKISFIILLPLLAIDLLVIHAFQLLDVKSYEPLMIALPLKLILLYTINGFTLISEKLLSGFI